jgi:tetratricopeptide (TPR) repeat protein
MTPERWQQIKTVLEEVDSLPPDERPAALDRLCRDDADLRREVESFLADSGGGTFIRNAIGEEAASLDRTAPDRSPGRQERFGPYRLTHRVGQGGMGMVYEAVRVDDFHKKVALKIVRQGLDSDFARTRFRQERQVLASLEHPYIARLLDGGESDDGSPYLVLEFVDGRPITEYCRNLDRTERLRLFLKVCAAVEHAHRNLVVHRDLKPANILVTAAGDPKLLDFGIAKLIDPGSTATQTGFAALTPEYASPEQVRGEPITTASDIYSLGIILYQLLTDRKPYNLETASLPEMDRVICLEPPAAPGLGDELDHILLMALRKEPERRYAGVQRFAEDIERYLDHRPVSARPDAFSYRAKKFVRRNWWQLAAVAALILVLVAGLSFSLMEERRANRRFNQVRQLAHRVLFDFHDEIANTPGTVRARGMIVSTALEYLNSLAGDAAGDPGLQWELAVAYAKVGAAQGAMTSPSLGRPREAIASYEKALALARPLAAANRLDSAKREILVGILCDTGEIYRFLREFDAALRLEQEAEARSAGLSAVVREHALAETAATLNRTGDLLGSVRALERTLAVSRENAARNPTWQRWQQVVAILTDLGVAQHRLTRFAEAQAAESEALAILKSPATGRPDTPRATRYVSRALTRLGDILGACDRPSLDQPQDAAARYQDAIVLSEALVRLDPNDVSSRTDVAVLISKQACVLSEADPRAAVPLAARATQIFDGAVPASNQYLAQPRIAGANAYRELGEFDAAERLLKEAEPLILPSDLNTRADLDLVWARMEAARGNRQAAARWFGRAIDACNSLFQKTPTPFYAWNLARVLQFAATAIPETAQQNRELVVNVWHDQNSRFPGQPYIQQQVADAEKQFDGR